MTTDTTSASRVSTPVTAGALFVAAVVGPLLFWVGQALLPQMPDALARAYPLMLEHRDRLMAARLFTAAGAFLLAFAAAYYVRLVPAGRGATLMRSGAVLFAVASFCNALSQAVSGYATWTVTSAGFEGDSARYVIDHIESGLVAMPLGFWSIPAFALGGLLMAAALWRARTVPAWLPPLLVVGIVLAGALPGRGALVALTQAPVTAALVVMAQLVGIRDADEAETAH